MSPKEHLRVEHAGSKLACTNYWQNPLATDRFVFVSLFGDELRLLIPNGSPLLVLAAPALGVPVALCREGEDTWIEWHEDPLPFFMDVPPGHTDHRFGPADDGRLLSLVWYTHNPALGPTESPRDCRRLRPVRGWSHAQSPSVFPRAPRAGRQARA